MPQKSNDLSGKVENPDTHYRKPADIAADKKLSRKDLAEGLSAARKTAISSCAVDPWPATSMGKSMRSPGP